jgi:hypothetical protein
MNSARTSFLTDQLVVTDEMTFAPSSHHYKHAYNLPTQRLLGNQSNIDFSLYIYKVPLWLEL